MSFDRRMVGLGQTAGIESEVALVRKAATPSTMSFRRGLTSLRNLGVVVWNQISLHANCLVICTWICTEEVREVGVGINRGRISSKRIRERLLRISIVKLGACFTSSRFQVGRLCHTRGDDGLVSNWTR